MHSTTTTHRTVTTNGPALALSDREPESHSPTIPVSKGTLWTARSLGALAVLFLLMDAVMKLLQPAPVVATFAQLGYPVDLAVGIGILELACVLLYMIPRTSVLGAILLTGFLGGAIATHVRVGSPFFSHTFFPVYVGVLVWGALFLREARLRALLPFRR